MDVDAGPPDTDNGPGAETRRKNSLGLALDLRDLKSLILSCSVSDGKVPSRDRTLRPSRPRRPCSSGPTSRPQPRPPLPRPTLTLTINVLANFRTQLQSTRATMAAVTTRNKNTAKPSGPCRRLRNSCHSRFLPSRPLCQNSLPLRPPRPLPLTLSIGLTACR